MHHSLLIAWSSNENDNDTCNELIFAWTCIRFGDTIYCNDNPLWYVLRIRILVGFVIIILSKSTCEKNNYMTIIQYGQSVLYTMQYKKDAGTCRITSNIPPGRWYLSSRWHQLTWIFDFWLAGSLLLGRNSTWCSSISISFAFVLPSARRSFKIAFEISWHAYDAQLNEHCEWMRLISSFPFSLTPITVHQSIKNEIFCSKWLYNEIAIQNIPFNTKGKSFL